MCKSELFYINKFYIQKKGLPMGSSLSPILTEIYMNDFEKQLITNTQQYARIGTKKRCTHFPRRINVK